METTVSIDLPQIASDLSLPVQKVERTAALLDQGNTIPFVTRYRKDQTGGLDEEQIERIQESVTKQRLLADRKATILKSIESQGKLTPKLASKIKAAVSTKQLEDLYLPFKPKKQTLATLARQRGLEPLAEDIYDRQISIEQLAEIAPQYVRVDKQLNSLDDVMQGVGYLLAERFSEHVELRGQLRRILWRTGALVSTAVSASSKREEHEVSGEKTVNAAESAARDAELGTDESKNPATAATEALEVAETPPKTAVKRESKNKKAENAFQDYANFRQLVTKVPPHRVLAINRGERAKALRVKIEPDTETIEETAEKLLIAENHPHQEFLKSCIADALSRLIMPALEREIRREITERAEEHAVRVFARNLRNLLLQPPVRGRRALAVDPGFRSGCKLAAIDQFGNVLGHGIIHIIGNEERRKQGRETLVKMIKDQDLSIITIGNGTACRETEELVSEVIADELKDLNVEFVIVNEAGASVYSTSPIGRDELPDFDPMVRSAISIGRRLLDPLSELVKINAANIGVGLYQHDVKATHLKDSLDGVIASCVNYVGVDVNTASPALLRYVSGLNQLTARRLVEHRQAKGPFKNREQLKEVAGFGEATFVQSAGFLKVVEGENPLDATWIHPESYSVASKVIEKLDSSVEEIAAQQRAQRQQDPDGPGSKLAEKIANVQRESLAAELSIGTLLLGDILAAIMRPGRDPREDLPPPVFRRGIVKLEDLKPGMELTGTVLNVVDFGAFVDIGLHDSGLVHISRLADRFVSDPHDVVSVGDQLKVWVLEVDKDRRRVSLTAIEPGTERPTESRGRTASRESSPRSRGLKKTGAATPAPKRKRVKPPKYKPDSRPKRKPKPVTPITKEMAEGKAPMRSFSDLAQFFDKKEPSEDE